ncbi:MAG: hypothetical protein ACK5U4_20310 [Rhodospirillales bacterium]|jgi:hypothetical protein
MFMEPENLRDTWDAAKNRREWLRRYESELRTLAATPGIGWGYVAEQLEAAGWSLHWGATRRLSAEMLGHEMAVIAFRARKRAGQGTSDRRLVRAVAQVVAPLADKIDALLQSGGLTPAAAAELQSAIAARAQPAPQPQAPTHAPATRTREITAPVAQTNLLLTNVPVETAPVPRLSLEDILKKENGK